MRRAEAGFTLLDVLVGILLLTVGGAGVLAIELAVIGANHDARLVEQATRLAEERMEGLAHDATAPTSGSDKADGRGCRGIGCTQQGTIFQRSWTVGTGAPAAIRVSVSWTDRDGRARAVVLDGLR